MPSLRPSRAATPEPVTYHERVRSTDTTASTAPLTAVPPRLTAESRKPSSTRLKGAARRLIGIRTLLPRERRIAGAEPGIDPKRHDLEDEGKKRSKQPGKVSVVEYDADSISFREEQGQEAVERLLQEDSKIEGRVRWISVERNSWDVVKPLALHFDLHPLALEDTLHAGASSRSKADYYSRHLFVSIPLHLLASPPAPEPSPPPDTSAEGGLLAKMGLGGRTPASDMESGAGPAGERSVREEEDAYETLRKLEFDGLPGDATPSEQEFEDAASRSAAAARSTIRYLTKDYKINIDVQHLSIFVLRDGTLLTFFQRPSPPIIGPIVSRLHISDTLLRSSADPSMLLQAILDVVVDHTLDIVEEFRKQLTALEGRVLVKPEIDAVRHLHILSAELLLLKRTLTPLHGLAIGLKDHDTERAKACARPGDDARGFISRQAKVYLSDVVDHIDSVLSSLEMFSAMSQNLVDYLFNISAYYSNESMAALSTITVIFLPLTFITGYFGMNFVRFAEIEHSVTYFWKIAIPTTCATVILFSLSLILKWLGELRRSVVRARENARVQKRRKRN